MFAEGNGHEPELLRKAVTSALQAAVDHKLPTVALPLLSSGIFSCPVDLAAQTAVSAVLDFLDQMDAGLQQYLQASLLFETTLEYITLQSGSSVGQTAVHTCACCMKVPSFSLQQFAWHFCLPPLHQLHRQPGKHAALCMCL